MFCLNWALLTNSLDKVAYAHHSNAFLQEAPYTEVISGEHGRWKSSSEHTDTHINALLNPTDKDLHILFPAAGSYSDTLPPLKHSILRRHFAIHTLLVRIDAGIFKADFTRVVWFQTWDRRRDLAIGDVKMWCTLILNLIPYLSQHHRTLPRCSWWTVVAVDVNQKASFHSLNVFCRSNQRTVGLNIKWI